MAAEKVLICGAGVAGSVLAFWLGKFGYQVVVVERSKADQKSGQGLEIEQPAWKVVEAMGILDKLKAKQTSETGFELVNERGQSCGVFKSGETLSLTGALEIMRGDLVEVLYKAADESANVTFHFSTTIKSLSQTQDKVTVELERREDKGTRTEEFDYVVGADGINSRTRQLLMGSPETLGCLKPVGALTAYFSIPSEPQDFPNSRACQFPGRRLVWLRPVAENSPVTSVYLIDLGDSEDRTALRQANAAGDRQKQKEALARSFQGLGWEVPRVIEQMMKAGNFYSDELAQVKLDKWHDNRVVLLGDSAWAPTPFTGQGNQLAIIAAWVLAQEMTRVKGPDALHNYEKRLRPFVEVSQHIPLNGNAPFFFCPQTAAGIWLFRSIAKLTSLVIRLVAYFSSSSSSPPSAPAEKSGVENFDLEMDKTI